MFNMASMHDQYMLTKQRRWKQHELWTCIPSQQVVALAPTKYAMATFLLCSNIAAKLLTGMIKEQTSPLASLEARWLAPAPA